MALSSWTVANRVPTSSDSHAHPIRPTLVLPRTTVLANRYGVTIPSGGGGGARPTTGQLFPRGQG